MTAAIAAGRRLFPRGYADFGYQLLIWFGFLAAYQVARGLADRDPTRAFANGWRVLLTQAQLAFYQAGYGQLAIIFPYVVTAPRFFAVSTVIEPHLRTSGMRFGHLGICGGCGKVSWYRNTLLTR